MGSLCRDEIISYEEALDVILKSVRQVETERAGIVNAFGRTLAEDVAAGDVLFPKGTLIGPIEMGALAALSRPAVAVSRRVRVAVITTGREVVDPMEELTPGAVRNINRYCLLGLLFAAGCDLGRLIHVSEDAGAITKALETPRISDAIILTAGPAGDEPVKQALSEIGVVKFSRVAVEPSAPTTFALISEQPVFGLPFDATACLIGFELFARPALLSMMGRACVTRQLMPAVLTQKVAHAPGRRGFVPASAWLQDGRVVARPLPRSADLTISANCLIVLPEDTESFAGGDVVEAMFLDSFVT